MKSDLCNGLTSSLINCHYCCRIYLLCFVNFSSTPTQTPYSSHHYNDIYSLSCMTSFQLLGVDKHILCCYITRSSNFQPVHLHCSNLILATNYAPLRSQISTQSIALLSLTHTAPLPFSTNGPKKSLAYATPTSFSHTPSSNSTSKVLKKFPSTSAISRFANS